MSNELTVIDAVVAPCPREVYAHLGQRSGLWRDARLDAWVAVEPDLVRAVLSHPELAVRPPDVPVPPALAGTVAGEVFAGFARMSDGARHRERRAMIIDSLDGFTPADAARATRKVLAWHEGQWTLHGLQFTVPVMAVGELLGVPPAMWVDLVNWTSGVVRGASPTAGPAEVAAALDAAPRLVRLFGEGRSTTTVANAIGFPFQTHDAMAGLIGGAIVALARNRDGDVERALAEALCHDAPIQNTRRYAVTDLRIGDAQVRRGDVIIVVLAAPDGDPEGCPFGHGAHRCPGEHIALAIARETVAFALENGMIPDDTDRPVRYHASGNARIPVLEELQGKDKA